MIKELILYDLDGTLADTRQDITASANHMRAQSGLGPLSPEIVCRYVGRGLPYLVSRCLATEDERKVEAGIRIYRAFYTDHMLDETRLYPFVPQVLMYLNGRRQAVVTNKPDPYSTEILQALGIAAYFIQIIAGNSPYPKKPDPSAAQALMRKENVEPKQTVIIGDSPVDVQTGRKLSITTVGVCHGFASRRELEEAKPDFLVSDFKSLLALARELGW